MIKAGALYLAIVMALIIAIISASLILLASHYRNSYLKTIRYNRLLNNREAAILYALKKNNQAETVTIDLFGMQSDSVTIEQQRWGIFEMAVVQSFIANDTLKKVFLMGNQPDSTALYLSDEDRPISLSGDTKIIGDAYIPKSGVRKAYVDGKAYSGKALIYNGKMKTSYSQLDPLDQSVLTELLDRFTSLKTSRTSVLTTNRQVSFFQPTQFYRLPSVAELGAVKLKGNLILYADSIIEVKADALLDGVQLYAPVIKIASGFMGNCQLFATDSIIIGKRVKLNYPSVLGIMRTKRSGSQPRVLLGQGTRCDGILFSYEKEKSALQTLMSLEQDVLVNGEIYVQGQLKLERGAEIYGKVACNRFIMKTKTTLYENFLIDATLNRFARSKYYLSSNLFINPNEKKVLKWLN